MRPALNHYANYCEDDPVPLLVMHVRATTQVRYDVNR